MFYNLHAAADATRIHPFALPVFRDSNKVSRNFTGRNFLNADCVYAAKTNM
jgi:hypothetical protein